MFIYASGSGDDVITDYAVGDKLKITGAKISKASVSGSNVVLTIGTGKVTLKGAKGKKLSIYNNSSSLTSTVIGGSSSSTLKTVTDSNSSSINVDSSVKLINASSRTKAVNITGNSLANTIRGGSAGDTIYGGSGKDSILGNSGNDKLYGDAGADTLIGGKGNDTLTGGAGSDVFVYTSGDGNDIITDYTATDGDIIQLGKNTTVSKVSFSDNNDFVLTIGTNKLTINNVDNQTVTVVDDSGVESLYRKRETANYEERNDDFWFTQDDNFVTNSIDSILQDTNIENSNSLGKVTTYDASTILTDKKPSLLTYSQDKK